VGLYTADLAVQGVFWRFGIVGVADLHLFQENSFSHSHLTVRSRIWWLVRIILYHTFKSSVAGAGWGCAWAPLAPDYDIVIRMSPPRTDI
jgi:hypothetical protein